MSKFIGAVLVLTLFVATSVASQTIRVSLMALDSSNNVTPLPNKKVEFGKDCVEPAVGSGRVGNYGTTDVNGATQIGEPDGPLCSEAWVAVKMEEKLVRFQDYYLTSEDLKNPGEYNMIGYGNWGKLKRPSYVCSARVGQSSQNVTPVAIFCRGR